MSSTRISRHLRAPRARVYRALLEPSAIARWMVPKGMTSRVHEFDAREGGRFRISLTHNAATAAGKARLHTDTCRGRFVRLVPDEQVVQMVELETDDPGMRGEMTITITLRDDAGGTHVLAVHEALPPGLSRATNETEWRSSLERLSALVGAG